MVHRVLIIGCGAIAGGYDATRCASDWPLSHAGAIARDDRFELAACVDPDPTARDAFVERWEVPRSADTAQGLAAQSGEYDIVVIASPTPFHAGHLEWALTMQPKAIFCEKPLAQTFEEASRIHQAAAAQGIPLALNHTRRWQPDQNALANAVRDGGEWGALISAVGTYAKGIVHNGGHMVDLLMMFAGPLRLHSVGPALTDHWPQDPTVNAILTARGSGAPIHLVGGDARAVTQFELVLNYESGEIAIRDGGARIETRRVEESPLFAGHRQLGAPTSGPGRYAEAMSAAYDNLADVIAGKAHPKWSQSHGITAQALCEEIRLKALDALKDKASP